VQGVQTTLPVGSIVQGRYRVEDLLGKGGFGAVYLVRDQRVRGNLFALKEVIDPSKKERSHFTFEGEVLKRLDHPSLPRVYRAFEDDAHNRAYILMDYIEGPNLEALRQKQPEKRFSLSHVLHVMGPVVEAVGFLHKQEPPIIHRDIKPSNIIVPTSGDRTMLVDFGIAKEYDQESTTTAIRRCSPGYGAPEQYAKGTNPSTDLYGLGATFYALLTGVVPTDALYRMTQLGSKHSDPLEPVTAFAPDVPSHVADAVKRAMSINSKERFASVEEFWQALHAQPIGSATPTPVPFLKDAPRPTAAPKTPIVAPLPPITPSLPATPVPQGVQTPQVARLEQRRTVVPPPGATTDVPTETVDLSPQPGRRRTPFLLLLVAIALLALLAGVVFGSGIFPALNKIVRSNTVPGIAQGLTATVHAEATPRPTHQPTTAPKATAVPTQKPVPTSAPAAAAPTSPPPVPTTPPPSAPGVYPVLSQNYDKGTIVDNYTSPATVASLALSNIKQNGANIAGNIAVGSGLVISPTFSGTVTSDNRIQFVVPSYNGLAPLFFSGQIQSDGSMKGTYCSYQGNNKQCDQSLGGYGSWSVQSSVPISGSTALFPDGQTYHERALLGTTRKK